MAQTLALLGPGKTSEPVLALGSSWRVRRTSCWVWSPAQKAEIATLGEEIGDDVLAVQYYMLADNDQDQATVLAAE
jgi:hypothetical protein